MKIRNGFVSNSSSSSFVVAFPKKPESVEDVKKMMFGKQEWHYSSIEEIDVPTIDIAEAVFKNIKNDDSSSEKEIYESIRNGWFSCYMFEEIFPGYFRSDETKFLNWDKDRDKIEKIWGQEKKENDKRAKKITKAFISGNENKYITVMEFSDNDGSFFAMLEHTNIFNRLKHIKTSYH
jgi:hypothetical protein